MARSGGGVYSLPANTLAVSGDPVSSTKFNTLVQDLEADANVDRPVSAGGTGASNASDARTNLGITGNLYDQTASAFVLTILNDADAAAVRTTIGAGTGDMLKSENLSGLANYTTARSNLGLVIGTNVQAWDAQLDDLAGLAVTDGGFIVGNGTNFVLETGATALASMGALAASAYTAADVLSKLLTVDGAGSGVDADTVDGLQASSLVQTTGAQSIGGVKTHTDDIVLPDAGPTSPLSAGYRGAPLNSQINDYTLVLSDAGKMVGNLGAGPFTYTIPANASVAFPVGTVIVIFNTAGAGNLTIAITSDTLVLSPGASTGSRTLAGAGLATLIKIASTIWYISGSGLT